MERPNPWMVVGLGNPGQAYEATRHNIGFRVVDALVRFWDAAPLEWNGPARLYRAEAGRLAVTLVEPLTYMNRSGDVFESLTRTVQPARCLIVYDDVDLPFGVLRFRERGGSGGHKGLASVLTALGTEDVPRLRMGIGGKEEEDLAEYVLSPFSQEEEEKIPAWVDRAVRGIRVFLEEGPEASMNQFNQQGL